MRTLLGRRRPPRDEVGVVGTARVAPPGRLPRGRWRAGDVAVLDLPHLDLRTAEELLARRPAAVLLAGDAVSARHPHRGPDVLLEAGVPLVDRLGPHLRDTFPDRTTVRVVRGRVQVGAGRDRWVDTQVPLQGRELDPAEVRAANERAARGMTAQLEAFAASTAQVLAVERDLLLEGEGVPQVPVRMAGRPVVVVAGGYGHLEDLGRLRRFVADRRPVVIGVDRGADAVVALGWRPDVVVTDPDAGDGHPAGVAALSSGAHVVVHRRPGEASAEPDGPGTTRFETRLSTEDAAVLLAHGNGAGCIVTAGSHATLEEFLDRGRQGAASTFLARLRAGGTVVDASTVALLHRPRHRRATAALLVLALLVLAVAVTAATPWGQEQLAVVTEAVRGWSRPGAGAG